MLSTDGHYFVVRRVIAGSQSQHHLRPHRLQMMHEDRFLSAGSEDQNLVARCDGFGDCREEGRIILHMARTDRVGVVVKMS